MFLAAGGMLQQERELVVFYQTQVAGDAAVEPHGGFGYALGHHLLNPGGGHKIIHDLCPIGRPAGSDQIDVFNGFLFSAQTAGNLNAVNGRVLFQVFQHLLRLVFRDRIMEALVVLAAQFDPF